MASKTRLASAPPAAMASASQRLTLLLERGMKMQEGKSAKNNKENERDRVC